MHCGVLFWRKFYLFGLRGDSHSGVNSYNHMRFAKLVPLPVGEGMETVCILVPIYI